MSRGRSGFPVGLLREISCVFGIISLQKRKITFLDYNSTFCLGGMERSVSLGSHFADLLSSWVLSMDQAPRVVKILPRAVCTLLGLRKREVGVRARACVGRAKVRGRGQVQKNPEMKIIGRKCGCSVVRTGLSQSHKSCTR